MVENNLVESIFTRMLQDVKEKIKTFVQMCEFVNGIICNGTYLHFVYDKSICYQYMY